MQNSWTEQEIETLLKCRQVFNTDDIAKKLDKSEAEIAEKLFELGLYYGPRREWTEDDQCRAEKMVERRLTHKMIAYILRIETSIVSKNVGSRNSKGNFFWTDEKLEELELLMDTMSTKELAVHYGKSVSSIHTQKNRIRKKSTLKKF